MRLQVLDSGHGLGDKMLFSIIKLASRQPVLDVIKLVKYRPDFYGAPMSRVTQDAMRGPSAWSVADRELMAAVVAQTNKSEFCVRAHSAVAQRAYGETRSIPSILSDPHFSGIEEPLRATLLLLRKLTRDHTLNADDMRTVLSTGASKDQVLDALAVCFAFNVISRLADAFDFAVPDAAAFASGAKYLLARGYQ